MNRKIFITFTAIVLAVAVFIVGYTRLLIPTLPGAMLYQGPRIIVEMHIKVDGKQVEIKKLDDSDAKIKNKDGYAMLTERINKCGAFQYEISVNGIPVKLKGYHFEWWEVIESKLYLSIDTENNTYTISENYYHTQQDNFFFCHRETKKEYPRTYEGLDNIVTNIGS